MMTLARMSAGFREPAAPGPAVHAAPCPELCHKDSWHRYSAYYIAICPLCHPLDQDGTRAEMVLFPWHWAVRGMTPPA